MAVNLSKNKNALVKAWEDLCNPSSKKNWVLFGYEGSSFDLKIVNDGEDGLEELVDELSGGKILYAGLRVIDPNSNLPKIVFINWQGEGVPSTVKGKCANHLRDITGLFRGAHVQINARSEDDVEKDSIMEKVKNSSGANYSFHKEAPKEFIPQGHVGTNYEKKRPDKEIDIQKKNEFWAKTENDEKQRKLKEEKDFEEQRIKESRLRAEREKKEEVAREAMIRERSKSIDEQKGVALSLEKKRAEEERLRYQQTLKEAEHDDEEFRKRSEEERKQRLLEANKLIQSRQQSPRESLKKSEEPEPTQTAVPNKGKKQPPPTVTKKHVKPVEALHQSENLEKVKPLEVTSAVVIPDAVSLPSKQVKKATPEPGNQLNLEPVQKLPPATVIPSNSNVAKALFDYCAVDENEITFFPDDLITNIEFIDDGWWRGTGPDGSYGLFPANYVKLIEKVPVVTHEAVPQLLPVYIPIKQEESVSSPSSHKESALGSVKKAKALFDYEAADETEISFEPDDIITNIDVIDEGWWRGTAPNGHYGLFPSNYVEEIFDGVPQQVDSPKTFGDVRARALYDYQAADETEITFNPDDVIINIEKVDEGWWRGMGPDGNIGLFPANYVELL